ncbi:hypothetical protein [uncultured Psychroserpens sp.]|uniref:hypothetical protein n=1 Tax=uncultured Psychroserpens sp. TaxID=255436 RepID=UPI0026034C43|nr:hypothetical protein [uncultured Psychroserpens sp.]
MKKALTFFLISCLFACNEKSNQHDYVASTDTILTDACPTLDSIRFCENRTNELCSNLPLEVYFLGSPDGQFQNGYSSVLAPEIQPSFDNFSWQSFVALNWPSDASGKPIGSNITDYPDSLRVWERFTEASKVFSAGDKSLAEFKSKNPKSKIVSQDSKVADDLHLSGFLEADDYPLIDRNLNFVIYEVKMNAVEEQYIKDNNLNTKEGIYNYYKSKNTIELPTQTNTLPGAIEIKASWRILDQNKGDDPNKYYTQNATIFVTSENSISGEAFSFDCTIGLVGLHVLRKTHEFENWIWSTFEHIDNVPDNVQKAQTDQEKQWSFYNSECLSCPVNQPPSHVPGDVVKKDTVYKWNTKAPYAERYATVIPGEAIGQKFGTQVTRVYPIYYCTEQLNAIWQAKLKSLGSVFENYKLVGTQWMVPTDGTPPPLKINAPYLLANTTAETYMQETSSCISCHTFAGIEYNIKAQDTTIFIPSDFSFTFLYAQ